jgi:hypothetical protein
MFGRVGGVAQQVAASTDVPLERLTVLTLGKEILRGQKRSAERSGVAEQPTPDGDDCFPVAVA